MTMEPSIMAMLMGGGSGSDPSTSLRGLAKNPQDERAAEAASQLKVAMASLMDRETSYLARIAHAELNMRMLPKDLVKPFVEQLFDKFKKKTQTVCIDVSEVCNLFWKTQESEVLKILILGLIDNGVGDATYADSVTVAYGILYCLVWKTHGTDFQSKRKRPEIRSNENVLAEYLVQKAIDIGNKNLPGIVTNSEVLSRVRSLMASHKNALLGVATALSPKLSKKAKRSEEAPTTCFYSSYSRVDKMMIIDMMMQLLIFFPSLSDEEWTGALVNGELL
jgi:hypothetical protein